MFNIKQYDWQLILAAIVLAAILLVVVGKVGLAALSLLVFGKRPTQPDDGKMAVAEAKTQELVQDVREQNAQLEQIDEEIEKTVLDGTKFVPDPEKSHETIKNDLRKPRST